MLVIANWKAYVEDTDKAKELFALAKRLASRTGVDLVLAPPAPQIGLLLSSINRSKVKIAAQDVSETAGGAATGEVSAQILADFGVSHVIVGHSERRARGETDEVILEKAKHTLAHGMSPILCVGERERDHDGKYLAVIRSQIAAVFESLSQKERMQVVIAYEPVWAIGKTALESITPHDLTEMMLYIRKVLGEYLPHKAPARALILYGGSVEPGNIRDLAASSGIDGFLVGHASVDAEMFTSLVKALA